MAVEFHGRRTTRDYENVEIYLNNVGVNFDEYVNHLEHGCKIINKKFQLLMADYDEGGIHLDTLLYFLKALDRFLKRNPTLDWPTLKKTEIEAAIKKYIG